MRKRFFSDSLIPRYAMAGIFYDDKILISFDKKMWNG